MNNRNRFLAVLAIGVALVVLVQVVAATGNAAAQNIALLVWLVALPILAFIGIRAVIALNRGKQPPTRWKR
ncbi:hypothetical protein [Streptomyces sp. P17]|uniref:hypothetical protein n=1 Tax=Streptomyces sp. P17 TaxID=3074716 RepID=UPI0028F44A21|nr:hypothetical protein [Streptomyces sp. P17]MDT9694738.1 hypothetical protein [Streptomyces sp. P17]